MRLEEQLDQLIADEGIILDTCYMPHLRGEYYSEIGEHPPLILISNLLEDLRERIETKAHEFGHHCNDLSDMLVAPPWLQCREEARARRWAAEYFLQPERLVRAALEEHVTTPFDLADYLEITLEQLTEGFEIMQNIHGAQMVHDGYVIQWSPFKVKRKK